MNLLRSISHVLSTIDRHPRRAMWSATVFTIAYYLLLSLQGLDFADEGFSLTFYQNFFSHPADVEYLFLYYLTGIIGGTWELLFGSWGTYGFRILFALTSGCIVLTAFSILRRLLPASTLFLGVIACTLWPGLCLYYFNWDCLTVLLFLLAVWSLLKGFDGNRAAYWLCGILLMLNTFTRLPNVTAFILLLFPLIEASYSGQYTKAAYNILRMMGGAMAGLILMVVIIHLLGHSIIYANAIESLFVMGNDSSDNHNIINMLSGYAYTYKSILTISIYSSLIAFTYVVIVQYVRKNGIALITGSICVALLYGLIASNLYGMWGAVTAGSIIFTWSRRKDFNSFLIGICALVLLILIPMGGDSYNNVCNSCLWLGMPLLISIFRHPIRCEISLRDDYGQRYHIGVNAKLQQHLCMIAGTTMLLCAISQSHCYFDNGSKFDKTVRPQTPLVTTYTSAQRARLVDAVVEAIRSHQAESDYLLIFDNAPMLHYLTGLRPYLGSPWSTFWGKEMYSRQLFRAENSSRQLPLIAIPHFFYEDLSATDYLDPVEHPELIDKSELLLQFIRRNGYKEVYSDDYITLLTPCTDPNPVYI